jgi:hypothetical protein
MTNLLLREQDWIWSRDKKDPDVVFRFRSSKHYTKLSMIPHPWLVEYKVPRSSRVVLYGADRLLSSLFYIELIGVPVFDTGGFVCQVRIRCRLTPSQPALVELVDRLRSTGACFTYETRKIKCVNHQVYEEIKRGVAFSQHVQFDVQSLDEKLDIKIHEITRKPQSISNCPYMLQTLIHDQGLDCVFGRRDHR